MPGSPSGKITGTLCRTTLVSEDTDFGKNGKWIAKTRPITDLNELSGGRQETGSKFKDI